MIDLSTDCRLEVLGIVERYLPNYEVRVVGSRARGSAKRYSDIDLLVLNRQPLSPRIRALARTAFEESDIPYKVDLIEAADLDPAFRDRLLEGSELLTQ